MKKETFKKILFIAESYRPSMKDYGIMNSYDLVVKQMPEILNELEE